MLHQIVLSAIFLILAFTTLPHLKADPDPAGAPPPATGPQQLPAFQPSDQHPTTIDVRALDASLNEIATWLSANFELPYAGDPPRLQLVPPEQLLTLRYKGLLPLQSQAIGGEFSTPLPQTRNELVAVYDDSTRTVYLPQGWTGATASERSVLVHEMVHHLQNVGGLKYPCGGAREKPAYLAQDQWLRQHGLELEKEFEVDMFTVVARSACMN